MTLDEQHKKLLNRIERTMKSDKEMFEMTERYSKMAQKRSEKILKLISLCREEST